MEFSRQEYRSELLFLPPGDLPDTEIQPASPSLAGEFFTNCATWTGGKTDLHIKTNLWSSHLQVLEYNWLSLFQTEHKLADGQYFRPAPPSSFYTRLHLPSYRCPVLTTVKSDTVNRVSVYWRHGRGPCRPRNSRWPWGPAWDGAQYLCPEAADAACTGRCQRCCGGSQRSSWQKPPLCCGYTERQSGSRRCRNPRGREEGKGIPSWPAFRPWIYFLPYPRTGSWGSPYWRPRSRGSCWGQANWKGEHTVKMMERYLKDDDMQSMKGRWKWPWRPS